VDEITLSPAVPQEGSARAAAGYLLSREDIACYNSEIAPLIAASASGYRLSRNRESLYLYGTTEQDIENAACGSYVKRLQVGCCFKPWYYAVLRENGDLVGCNTVKHSMARIGNVREESLEHLWHSARYRGFRASCRPPQFEDCRRCCYHTALLNRQIEEALPAGFCTPATTAFGRGAN
jgi:radical SAM protein with 4Fe4S-binding SPASM domain